MYGSGLPQPASAMKRPNTGARMSMAPPRTGGMSSGGMRASMGGNLLESGGGSTVKRSSVRKSMMPMSQPPASVARRSSAYAGRPSMGGPSSSSGSGFFTNTKNPMQKDPRPLKDPAFKRKMQTEIQEYLLENNFEMEMKHQLPPTALSSPTQKDFYHIFQWLYMRLDPNYVFSQVKPETEVLPLLANLKYPYTTTITKTQLTAVGSGNTWPTLLGMLHWMMELAQVTDRYRLGDMDHYAEEEGHTIGVDKIVFNYTAKCYNAWLNENDDHEEFEREMMEAFDERDAVFNEQLKAAQEENEAYKAELDELDEKMQPLQQARDQRAVLEEDIKKFAQFVEFLEGKYEKLKETILKIRAEMDGANLELEAANAQKLSLQEQVDRQGLSPADIDRMNSEKEKLNQGANQIAEKLKEAQAKLETHEDLAISKLEALEHAVGRYNQLAYQIGITPSSAPQAAGRDFELQILPLQQDGGEGGNLLLDARTGYQPGQTLNVDIRNTVKPFLEDLRRGISSSIHNTMDESIKTSEHIDRIVEILADKKDELETLEAKVQSTNNEYQEFKEYMQQEINTSNAEMEKQSANLKQMRVGMNKGRLEAEQKLQSTSIEYYPPTPLFFPTVGTDNGKIRRAPPGVQLPARQAARRDS
jgi:kinetochore protein NDC80